MISKTSYSTFYFHKKYCLFSCRMVSTLFWAAKTCECWRKWNISHPFVSKTKYQCVSYRTRLFTFIDYITMPGYLKYTYYYLLMIPIPNGNPYVSLDVSEWSSSADLNWAFHFTKPRSSSVPEITQWNSQLLMILIPVKLSDSFRLCSYIKWSYLVLYCLRNNQWCQLETCWF